ncbi:hypothetical protein HYDPIDRAFT_93610 [Hydnomerulius pinastri MD-312]|uniref:glutathione transferase n=1 Tax=Hydnomerulius pinastri MD-312 TaxID=994086 RepID=A0A0C9VAZ3_9AGAM|nr:hypothetical protein HYDPIDRAFT_93610 [Hydnomerulius pinastri MD-312]
MVPKIYGSTVAICARRVLFVCHELNILYEVIRVYIANDDHKKPAHLEKQPFGQIPYIDDDGFILFKSRAICRYLVRKYGHQGTPDLLSTDIQQEALFEQAASIESFNYDPNASGIAIKRFFRPIRGIATNEARVQEYVENLGEKLDAYDVVLSKQKYLAGDNATLADIFHVPYGMMVIKAGFGDVFEKRANVWRWLNELRNRPGWLAVEALDTPQSN